jgi:DNA-binding transcriptional MerR regulator
MYEMSNQGHGAPKGGLPHADGQGPPSQRAIRASDDEYAIGELAREFNTTLRTLRFYEDEGLLHPHRIGLKRVYSQQDRARLKLIVIGKKVDLSLEEIADMLDVYQLPKVGADQLISARASMHGHIDLLGQRKINIEQALRELYSTVDVLTDMLQTKQRDRQNK